MARREEIAQARQTVAVIGGTGALGFGLALRWAIAGVPIVIGSRDAERAAEAADEGGDRAREAGARDPQASRVSERGSGRAARTRSLLAVPFRAQSENLNNLRNALQPADRPGRRDRPAGGRRRRSRDPHARRLAGLGGPAGRTRWRRAASRSCPRFHTVSAAALSDPVDRARRGRADRRRRPQVQGRRRRAGHAHPRAATGRLRRARDRAHPRAAHAAVDLGQQAPQDQALGHPLTGLTRRLES